MSERNKDQNTEVEAPSSVSYAVWDVPETSLKVIYSLPLFHEIDFVVNEGYRKIPHGGIEVGGLLFGAIENDTIRIEAFRPIHCEHASGPSFTLSERDLGELKNQITQSATDAELKKFEPVGWFLAHTRGPLQLTDAEAKQFDQFFPDPLRLTVLVKPERFQPTRFGFLVRTADAEMPRDAAPNAVILPLPGRSKNPGNLLPSLAAPAVNNTPKRPVRKDESERRPERAPNHAREQSWEELIGSKPAPAESEPLPALPDELRSPAELASRRQFSRDRARVIEQAFPRHPQPAPFKPPVSPIRPAGTPIHVPTAYDRYQSTALIPVVPPRTVTEPVLNVRSVTALALAALLGCLVGYIAYLQLPSPVIPINVRTVNQTIVVSWPPNQTRSAVYAAIRLNDGPPVPLSADEKKLGQVSLTNAKDFKVEVLARNWIRDSRGIVRYMHSANGNGQVVPDTATLP